MKESRSRQVLKSVILILVDVALFIALVLVLREPLISLVGYDITDYENWYGDLDHSRVYRFGAGCYEYLFVVLKAAVLILLEKISYTGCKGPKIFFIIAIIIHTILFLLCIAYVYSFLDGANIYWLLRYFLTGAEPPF